MSLIKTIKADSLAARKAKDKEKSSLLITLLGEAQKIGKDDGNRETTDEETVRVIRKFIKGAEETKALFAPDSEPYKVAEYEIKTISEYLPVQLTSEDLLVIVSEFVLREALSSPKDMGKVMAMLKDKYEGQYDGKLASQVVRHVLVG